MFRTLRNAFKIEDLRNKLFFTFMMLFVIRLGSQIPVPGVDRSYFSNWFSQQSGDAFAKVKPGDYDMILMDVQMPVMDGLEATRRIRSSENPLGKTIPILAMTANAFLEDMQKSKEAGMDEHLSKPVDIAMLEQVVRRFRITPPADK